MNAGNGSVVLQVTGHPDYGVPFGRDRIVPIVPATLAVQQESQTIRFRTAAKMLETFGMHKGGKEYRRLIAAFERIFGATIFFGADTFRGTAEFIRRSRFNFLREAQIWYNRRTDQPVLSEEFETCSTSSCGVRIGASWPKARKRSRSSVSRLGRPTRQRRVRPPAQFREKLEQWLRAIHVMWPECPARINATGTHVLLKNAASIRPR